MGCYRNNASKHILNSCIAVTKEANLLPQERKQWLKYNRSIQGISSFNTIQVFNAEVA